MRITAREKNRQFTLSGTFVVAVKLCGCSTSEFWPRHSVGFLLSAAACMCFMHAQYCLLIVIIAQMVPGA